MSKRKICKRKTHAMILLCSIMEEDKEKPLVICKNKKPRCFKGAHVAKLPIEWTWMTLDIMSTLLKCFANKMRKEKKNVLNSG